MAGIADRATGLLGAPDWRAGGRWRRRPPAGMQHRPFLAPIPLPGQRRSVRRVSTVVRVARVLLILVLALLTTSFLIGLGTASTGPVEKAALLALIGGCVYAAAKASTLAEWAIRHLARH